MGANWIELDAFFPWLARIRYQVSTKSIKYRSGFFVIKRETTELYRVKDFTVYTRWWHLLIGNWLSDLIIYSSDLTNPIMTFRAIRKASDLEDVMRYYVKEAASPIDAD